MEAFESVGAGGSESFAWSFERKPGQRNRSRFTIRCRNGEELGTTVAYGDCWWDVRCGAANTACKMVVNGIVRASTIDSVARTLGWAAKEFITQLVATVTP